MNATTKAIIDRLPKKPLLSPGDLAAACGLATNDPVIADIKMGKLQAVRIGGRYIVSFEAAKRYIELIEYVPQEGSLK